jgi:hypothetical protein
VRTFCIVLAATSATGWATGCLGPERGSTASLNQEVRDGGFAFTVTSVDLGTPTIGHLNAQGVYVLVDLSVKNIGDAARTVYCQDQQLKDLAGRTYDNAVTVGAADDLTNIKPGGQARATCAFDVPKGALPGAVVVHGSAYSKGVTVTVLTRSR